MDSSSAVNIINMSKKAVTISTSTCPPCRVMGEMIKSKYPEGIEGYEKVVVDTEGLTQFHHAKAFEYMQNNGIGGVPCTVFFDGDEPVSHMMGGSSFTIRQIEYFLGVSDEEE